LLTRCLGWQKPDVRVEVIDEGGGRADYILGSPAKGVVEAKRPALVWDDVPQASKKKVRSLETLCLNSKELGDAVTQIIPYCARKGAALAVVCNGPQMVIFQGVVIGNEPAKGECFFFNGFSDYLQSFLFPVSTYGPDLRL
jgi:predicted type IV restriction endonuclease